MAFMSQAKKKQIVANLKQKLAGTGMKYSVAVRNHSTIVLTFTSGPVDFLPDIVNQEVAKSLDRYQFNVNTHWMHEHLRGKSLEILQTAKACLDDGNHDRSDIMTDYFDVGWYIDIQVGRWDKPYVLTA